MRKRKKEKRTYECWNARLLAPLHKLLIALEIRRNKHDLSTKALIRLLHKLHHIRPPTPLFRIPETHPLRLDPLLDQAADRRPERLLLVGADPDEVPVLALQTCREGGTETCAGAYADPASVERRGI